MGSPPAQGRISHLVELLASFLRAGPPAAKPHGASVDGGLDKVIFERAGFWLAAPNVLNERGLPLIGFTVRNGSWLLISSMDVHAALHLDGEAHPSATGVVRIRCDVPNGLQAGGTFSGVAKMLMLSNDDWVAARVLNTSAREVRLKLSTAYDVEGKVIKDG